jgi:hypothetical protein
VPGGKAWAYSFLHYHRNICFHTFIATLLFTVCHSMSHIHRYMHMFKPTSFKRGVLEPYIYLLSFDYAHIRIDATSKTPYCSPTLSIHTTDICALPPSLVRWVFLSPSLLVDRNTMSTQTSAWFCFCSYRHAIHWVVWNPR